MKLPRRQFLQLAAAAGTLPAATRIARAQSYPMRPVRIISGYPPGGSNDIYARLIARSLSERLGRQFFVENRAGAGGTIGADAVAKALPDGYTLLLASSGETWNATLYPNLRYNFVRDIAPIGTVARGSGALVVNDAVPVKSVPELIAYAKTNPGKISVASAGVGSSPHMYWELFKSMTGVDMLHVPYRGGAPALIDLLGGQVQVYFPTVISVIEHIKAGRLRALAVTSAVRSDALPDIPTVGEFVPGYEATTWYGLGAPRNAPAEIIDELNKEINAALADPRMKARIAEVGDRAFANSVDEFRKLIAEDTEKWGKVIRAANMTAD
jgi:tripartite-type tricarboxylate transporter receptor subunit TctC